MVRARHFQSVLNWFKNLNNTAALKLKIREKLTHWPTSLTDLVRIKRRKLNNLYSYCIQEHKIPLYWNKKLAGSTVLLCSYKTCCWPGNTFFVVVERSVINPFRRAVTTQHDHTWTHYPHTQEENTDFVEFLYRTVYERSSSVWKVEHGNWILVWPDSLTRARRSGEESVDLWLKRKEGNKGGQRRGAIQHQQALSPTEVCVSMRWRRRCAGVWSVRGNGKALTVQLFKKFQKQANLHNLIPFCLTHHQPIY